MDTKNDMNPARQALLKAIRLAGSQEKLAKAIGGVTQQAISKWLKTLVDGDWVIKLCAAVSFQVTPHELRADLYPHPDDGMPDALRQARAAE